MDPFSLATGIVGFAGLSGLFSTCLDVIERVDSYKDYGIESRAINAQFEADKYLFKQWAQVVGIDREKSKNNNNLDNPETALVVQSILSSIQEIFSHTRSTVSKLRPVVEAGPTSFPDGVLFLTERNKSENLEGPVSKRSRLGWSLRGKAKFIYQVQQFGALVQKLSSLVPTDGLARPVHVYEGEMGIDRAAWFSNSQRLLIDLEKQIEHETRKELDTWLDVSWTNIVYDNLTQRRLDGTCDWILTQDAFLDWTSSDFPSGTAKILWINGPAGYGKTILCARIVQYLSTVLDSPLAYYFCSSDSENRRDPLSIMRSWMSQIISCYRDAFELACSGREAKEERNASQSDIIELFKTIVQHTPNCTFVVDGLDECAWADEKWKSNNDDSLTGFFESINLAVAHTNTRILVLSRDEPEIRYGLRAVLTGDGNQGFKEYKICPDAVRSDALLFSRSIVDKRLAKKSEEIKHELSQRMVERCEGMFLWVKMLEEQLRSWKNKRQLEETIDEAPIALDHMYDRNWMKISHLPEKDKLRAVSILRWTAFALRPLTILEITEALVIVDDEHCEDLLVDELPDTIDEDFINHEILGPCGSLLETQEAAPNQDLGSMTLHLAHFSVKQYILCNMPAQGGLLTVNESLRATNEAFQSNVLAKLCLRYLSFQRVWQESLPLDSGTVDRSFRDYALESWHHHARESGLNYKEVVGLINALFSSDKGNWQLWKKWFDAHDGKSFKPKSQRETTSTSPLFYASLLGLRETVIYLLDEAKLDVNHVGEGNQTALQAAASKGHTFIVELLLEKGADLTVENCNGFTPVIMASGSGHIEVVKLLLDKGADITVANNGGWTPLIWASESGHAELVKLLLEKGGADVAVATNVDGWTPLILAAGSGHVEVVKLLLEMGADITVASKDRWTPLILAAGSGHVEVVKLLLEKGADITVASKDGWTPLILAAGSGHVEVVKLLLEMGGDITVASKHGFTPLTVAAVKGHVEVVKLLLKKGADITVASNNGWTALNAAVVAGHVEVVKLLLEKAADITVTANDEWMLLMLAAGRGHVKVVKVLLEKGADITAANKSGLTPLSVAAKNGHVEVVKLLLGKGADLTVKTSNGSTLLILAAGRGHVEVVKLLLDKGADLTVANKHGFTPLIWASKSGQVEVIKLLLEKEGADIAVASNDGWTSLSSAINNGHVEVVKLLLEKGANLIVRDQSGRTPIFYAARYGHEKVFELLLADGSTDPDYADQYNSTLLSIAARNGHEGVVKLLLADERVALDSKDAFGRTPIWWSRRNGYSSIERLLTENAQRKGIIFPEIDFPKERGSARDNKSPRWCDVCTLGISRRDVYFECGICDGGDFNICSECYEIGARCRDDSHQLVKGNESEVVPFLD